MPDEAMADAEAALTYSPDLAQAYLMIGQVFEYRGEASAALAAYQQASDLAEAQDNVGLLPPFECGWHS